MYHEISGHSFRKLIGSDPGATKVQSLVIVETDGTSRDRALLRKEYIHGRGDNIANAKRKALEARPPEIKAINARMPSLQVPTMDAVVRLFKYRWGHAMALRNLYLVPVQARTKRRNEVQRKQFQEKFVRSLAPECQTPCERAGVIVVTGDSGRFASLRGFAPAAVGWFEPTCLRRGYTVVRMDEYRTSKLCCGCHNILEAVPGNPWGTRACSTCRYIVDRDANAARNMIALFSCMELHGGARPARFARGQKPPAARDQLWDVCGAILCERKPSALLVRLAEAAEASAPVTAVVGV